MGKVKYNLLERLKICLSVLRDDCYVYTGIVEDRIKFKEGDGTYDGLMPKAAKCWINLSLKDDYNINMKDFFLGCTSRFLEKYREEQYPDYDSRGHLKEGKEVKACC